MSIINVWIGLRDDAQYAVMDRLNWDTETRGDYSGPIPDRHNDVFKLMADQANTQRLFKTATLSQRAWSLWSTYFDLKGDALREVRSILDQMALDYPTQFVILGVWHNDGRQVGTQFVYSDVTRQVNDTSYDQPMVANPAYDIDAAPEEPTEILDPTWTAPDPWPQVDVVTNEITGTRGTSPYPPHAKLIKFMPDVDGVAATELVDINLAMGQAQRRFS
jgi:hypothetical protein